MSALEGVTQKIEKDPPYMLKIGTLALDTEQHRVYLKGDPERPRYGMHPRGFAGYSEIRLNENEYECILALIKANGDFISSDQLQLMVKGHITPKGGTTLIGKFRRLFETEQKGSSAWFVSEHENGYRLEKHGYALRIPV